MPIAFSPTDPTHARLALAFDRVARLHRDLQACHSATAALQEWCARYSGAPDAAIKVRHIETRPLPATPAQRRRLAVLPGEPVAYRRVQLLLGAEVLSEAGNWFVPARLTPAMNHDLASDIPFGRIVAALAPSRSTIASDYFWGSPTHMPIPAVLFRHRAVLSTRDGTPFSEVDEHYTNSLLAVIDG